MKQGDVQTHDVELDKLLQSKVATDGVGGRLDGVKIVAVDGLFDKSAGPLTARSCDGDTVEIPALELAPAGRWVLTPNQNGELKLLDMQNSSGGVKPTLRSVTVLHR